jgi:hypothetical protein
MQQEKATKSIYEAMLLSLFYLGSSQLANTLFHKGKAIMNHPAFSFIFVDMRVIFLR